MKQCLCTNHAPPSKRVVLDERHEAPLHLVSALLKQWDRPIALVLADWMEHQGFAGFAQKLRRKAFGYHGMRRTVENIASGMGLTHPYTPSTWVKRKPYSKRALGSRERLVDRPAS